GPAEVMSVSNSKLIGLAVPGSSLKRIGLAILRILTENQISRAEALTKVQSKSGRIGIGNAIRYSYQQADSGKDISAEHKDILLELGLVQESMATYALH
ncbi:hypothetical protein BGZ46_002731, partial [Entomortierella lignicola]